MLAGGSDTSNVDPYGENFCFFVPADNLLCSAFQWQNGVMSALPGLGGNNSFASNSNRSGHIVGWGETSLDPSCLAPQFFDFHGALWRDGGVQDLPPLSGDAISAAAGINELGVAVGGSGFCASPNVLGFALSLHAVIWQNGSPTDLGSLGGEFNNAATDINNLGHTALGRVIRTLLREAELHSASCTLVQGIISIAGISPVSGSKPWPVMSPAELIIVGVDDD